ncbi:MAG: BPSS1780 family membrane protein [Pseudomonadota bacterium]
MNQSPHFRKRSFGDGMRWLGQAAELMSKGGSPLVGVAVVLLLISLIQWLPVLGIVALTLITPLLTAGLITVFRVVDEGQTPSPGMLFAGWREGAGLRFLVLGVWLLLGLILAFAALALWIMPQVDPDLLNQLMQDPDVLSNDPDALLTFFQGVNLFGGLAIAFVIFAIVIGGLYFAVPLVHFWQWPVIPALLWSLRAMLVNWLAFLGFGLLMFAVLFAASFMFGLVIMILSLALGPVGDLIGQGVVLIASLFVQLLYAATQWVAFREIFDESNADSSSGDELTGNSDSVEI